MEALSPEAKKLALIDKIVGVSLGVQVLLKGVDKAPYFSHFPLHVGFLFLAGVFIMAGTFLHHRLEKRVKNVHALFHLIEGLVLMVTALILLEKGKVRMPVFFLGLGLLYFVLGLVTFRMNGSNRAVIGRRLMRGVGLLFLVGGLVVFVSNFWVDKDGWVFGVGVVITVMGVFYLLKGDWIVQRFMEQEAKRRGAGSQVHSEP